MAIDSVLDWWNDAGLLDAVQDTPCLWLQPLAPPAPVQITPKTASATPVAPEPAAAQSNHPLALPANLQEFEAWLRGDPALPGADWGPLRILPAGPHDARLMVISDMPDVEDIAAGQLLSGPVGALFDAMLGAIGLERPALRLASVALTRPAGGRWDDDSAAGLREVTLHHVSLVKPAQLLLLGQQTCRLLTGEDVSPDGHGLRNINHYGVTTAAVAIHHPRTLLRQQALKRGAWTALKQLREHA